jgi:hypothetical protein
MPEFENEDEFTVTETTDEREDLVEEHEHFMTEDIKEEDKACALCVLHKVTKDSKNFVCGTFKARNDFAWKKGYPPIEDTFFCSEFKSV